MGSLLGYKDLPSEIQSQMNRVVDIWKRHLGDNLTGVYLHGSIVLNAFHPDSGDIDILVVARDSLEVETKLDVARDIIEIDKSPQSLEMSAWCLFFVSCPIEKSDKNVMIFRCEDMEKPFVSYNEGMWDFFEPELKKRLYEISDIPI